MCEPVCGGGETVLVSCWWLWVVLIWWWWVLVGGAGTGCAVVSGGECVGYGWLQAKLMTLVGRFLSNLPTCTQKGLRSPTWRKCSNFLHIFQECHLVLLVNNLFPV